MSLSTYALVTVDEYKTVHSLQGSGMDAALEAVINRVSDMLEAYLGRLVVTRTIVGTPATRITEYHTLDSLRSALFLSQYPVITITSVDEGFWSAGTWTSSASFTEGTDYIADKASGKLTRISSGFAGSWFCGFEGVRVVYSAGVATTADVPQAIKDVALSLAGRKFREAQRGGEAQQIQDGLGMTTRFMPSELLRMEKEALGPWRSWDYSRTGRVA